VRTVVCGETSWESFPSLASAETTDRDCSGGFEAQSRGAAPGDDTATPTARQAQFGNFEFSVRFFARSPFAVSLIAATSNNGSGVHIFDYTFNTLAFQTLIIADSTSSSLIGSAIIDVVPKT
jgi:hypothetical protein